VSRAAANRLSHAALASAAAPCAAGSAPARRAVRRPEIAPAGSRRRARLALLAAACAAGCVVVEERGALAAAMPAAAPISIPLDLGVGGGAAAPHDLYYRSVVSQLQRAWLDGDREHLANLLDVHERPDAPAWAQETMAGFRAVLGAMHFEAAIVDRGTLLSPEPLPAIGEPLVLTVRLGPLPGFAVRLRGGDDPARARFLLVLRMADTDAFGARAECSTNVVVDLPRAIDFAAGDTVDVPVTVDVGAGGTILREIEVEAFLMPGHVEISGRNLPNRRVRCAVGSLTLVPRGHDAIVAKPLATLLAALQLGDPAHFAHVLLAARVLARPETPDADREQALRALVDRVRLGRDDQVRNAIAALAHLVPDVDLTDRAGWLQWWGRRTDGG